jgi:hypothetical protein
MGTVPNIMMQNYAKRVAFSLINESGLQRCIRTGTRTNQTDSGLIKTSTHVLLTNELGQNKVCPLQREIN